MVPRAWLDNLTKALRSLIGDLSVRCVADVEKAVEQLSPEYVEDAAVEIITTYAVEAYEASGVIGAEFYDSVRERETGERLGAAAKEAYREKVRERVVDRLRLLREKGYLDLYQQAARDSVDVHAQRGLTETQEYNALKDPKRPRFARVPTGAVTCRFCIMLASRGAVYKSKKTASKSNAGDHYHPNCDCKVVPVFGNSSIEGYEPDYYYDCWKNPDAHPEISEAINARRRELYSENKDEINARRRAKYAEEHPKKENAG